MSDIDSYLDYLKAPYSNHKLTEISDSGDNESAHIAGELLFWRRRFACEEATRATVSHLELHCGGGPQHKALSDIQRAAQMLFWSDPYFNHLASLIAHIIVKEREDSGGK